MRIRGGGDRGFFTRVANYNSPFEMKACAITPRPYFPASPRSTFGFFARSPSPAYSTYRCLRSEVLWGTVDAVRTRDHEADGLVVRGDTAVSSAIADGKAGLSEVPRG